jgi:hypothetical protein
VDNSNINHNLITELSNIVSELRQMNDTLLKIEEFLLYNEDESVSAVYLKELT